MSAQVVGSDPSTDSGDNGPKLVGNVDEVQIRIGNIPTQSLLDSGSCVSLVAESFYNKHLADNELKSVEGILNIECANGGQLPYIGYIETDVIITSGLPGSKPMPCLILVSPDTPYSNRTPVVIGTNILNELLTECKDNYGSQFLQKAKLHTQWYLSFRAIVIRQKELKRNSNRLAVIRNASKERIILKPNDVIEVKGYADRELNFPCSTAIIQESDESQISSDVDIENAVIQYNYKRNGEIRVCLSNITTNTITIPPRSIIGEIQPATLEEEYLSKIAKECNRDNVIPSLNIDEAGLLNSEQRKELVHLLHKHENIFSTSDTDIGICNKIKHRIDLITDIPFKQRHRRIPPAMIQEVREHIEQLLAAGVIVRSKSPYTSNVVLVRKKNGKLRLCVDYRQLNNITIEDSFALPRMDEIFDSLHGSKYYSTIDMKSGYHQIEVEEVHKERTAFTVGSIGFYQYEKNAFRLDEQSSDSATHHARDIRSFEHEHLSYLLR